MFKQFGSQNSKFTQSRTPALSSGNDIGSNSALPPSNDIVHPDAAISVDREISTDIFEVASSTVLKIDETDSLKEMKTAINLLLHPQVITNMESFENDFSRFHSIEIGGDVKWSLQEVMAAHEAIINKEKKKADIETLAAEEAKRKVEFEKVKKEFLAFPDDQNAELKIQKLFGLEQSIMHAAFPVLERNYRFNHKKYVYHIDGRKAQKKIARNGNIFSIVCQVPIYWLIDGIQVVNNSYSNVDEGISVQDSFLALNEDGKLEAYPTLHSKHENKEICHLSVIGEIDLNNFSLEQNSIRARFRIEIVSACREFNYYGPINDSTAIQIQNKPDIEYYDFSSFPKIGSMINQFLSKKSTEMDSVIKRIYTLKDKIEANRGHVGTIFSIQRIDSAKKELMENLLRLFNLAMNKNAIQKVVDLFCEDLLNKISEVMPDEVQITSRLQSENLKNPANKDRYKQIALLFNDNVDKLHNAGIEPASHFLQYLCSFLEKNKKINFEDLLKQTIDELVLFFDELGEGKLIELYLMLKMNFVYELNYSAIYVEKNAERFKLDAGKTISEQFAPIVQQEASATMQKIRAIDYALNSVLKNRGYKIIYPGNIATIKAGDKNDEEVEQPNEFLYSHLRNTVKRSAKNKLTSHIYSDLVQFYKESLKALKSSLPNDRAAYSLNANKVQVKVGVESVISEDISHQISVALDQPNPVPIGLIDVRNRGDFVNIFNTSEKIAILMERGPFLKGINEGLLMHYIIDLELSSYPTIRQDAQKYLIISDIIGGLVGTLIGRYAILNPSKPLNKSIVRWEALTRGLSLLVFTMFDSIIIYRNYFNSNECPDRQHCQMNNKMFWTTIALPSGLFALANITSELTYASQYLNYGQVSHLKYRVAKWFSNSFYNTLLQQTFLLKVVGLDKTDWEVDTFIPATITGFLLATLQAAFPRRKFNNFIPVITALLSAVTFFGIWYRQSEGQRQQGIDPLAPLECVRIAFWSMLFIYQSWFIRRNHTQFVSNYTGDFIQIIKVEPIKPQKSKRSNSIDLSYQALPNYSEDGKNPNQNEISSNSSGSPHSSQLDFSVLDEFYNQSTSISNSDNDEKINTRPPALQFSQSTTTGTFDSAGMSGNDLNDFHEVKSQALQREKKISSTP